MFREICTLISTLTGFPIGGKLQAGRWAQDKPQRCVLVQEGGGVPTFYPNGDMVDMAIQVLCRAEKQSEAREDAWVAFDALHATSGWNLPRIDGSGPDYLAMTVEALSAPQYLGEDDNRRHLYSVNFIFRMEEGSCFESGSI